MYKQIQSVLIAVHTDKRGTKVTARRVTAALTDHLADVAIDLHMGGMRVAAATLPSQVREVTAAVTSEVKLTATLTS